MHTLINYFKKKTGVQRLKIRIWTSIQKSQDHMMEPSEAAGTSVPAGLSTTALINQILQGAFL